MGIFSCIFPVRHHNQIGWIKFCGEAGIKTIGSLSCFLSGSVLVRIDTYL